MKRIARYLVAIIIFLNGSLHAGTIDPYNQDINYLDYAQYFDYVGCIQGSYADKTHYIASAVAIDDHHILTAAHIVQNTRDCFVQFGDKKFEITKIMIPKQFKPDHSGIADIALAYSETSFNLRFYPPLYTKFDEKSKVCCICGYGKTGSFSSGSVVMDGKKRAGSNLIDGISAELLVCSPSPYSANNSSNRTSLEFLISQGDSGGGLFIDGELAGINSCIISDKKIATSNYSDSSGHTRVSKYVEWINSNKIVAK